MQGFSLLYFLICVNGANGVYSVYGVYGVNGVNSVVVHLFASQSIEIL